MAPMDPGLARAAPRVAYIHSPHLLHLSTTHTHPSSRAQLVHDLIKAFGYLEFDAGSVENKGMGDGEHEGEGEGVGRGRRNKAVVVRSGDASREELLSFHTEAFVGTFQYHQISLELIRHSET